MSKTGHLGRTPRTYEVTVAETETQKATNVKVNTYWSEGFPGFKEAVAMAACGKAFLNNKRQLRFIPVNEPTLVPAA